MAGKLSAGAQGQKKAGEEEAFGLQVLKSPVSQCIRTWRASNTRAAQLA